MKFSIPGNSNPRAIADRIRSAKLYLTLLNDLAGERSADPALLFFCFFFHAALFSCLFGLYDQKNMTQDTRHIFIFFSIFVFTFFIFYYIIIMLPRFILMYFFPYREALDLSRIRVKFLLISILGIVKLT